MITLALGAACLSTPTNGYLYACTNGQVCPTGSNCASDNLCHPVYIAGAGPADAGNYACAMTAPQCPDGQVCGTSGLCADIDAGTTPDAGDAGSTPDAGDAGLPDAGDAGSPDAGDAGSPDAGDAGMKVCDLASAFPGTSPISCGAECTGLAIGDFNHDGYADVVVAVETDDNSAAGLSLLLNHGDQTFSAPITTRALLVCQGGPENGGDNPIVDSMAVADFNGDGWPDLALNISEGNQLALAINGQDSGFIVGGFQPATSTVCTYNFTGVNYAATTAYRTNGGWSVAAVGYGIEDSNSDSIVAIGNVQGNGLAFNSVNMIEPAEDYIPTGILVGSFAGDPLPSAVLSEANIDTSQGQIEVFAGTQSGTMASFSSMAAPTLICQQGTNTSTSADLDGDGLLDLITVNFGSSTVEVFYAKDGGFKPGVSFSTTIGDAGTLPAAAAVADLDGDGRPDIATVNISGSITILKGLTDGGFLAVTTAPTTGADPYWISAVDLEDRGVNDGGLADLVVSYLSNGDSSAVDVYYNGCR